MGIKHNYLLISQLKYFKSSGGTFISAGYGHVRANFFKMNKISYEVFTQIQYDRTRNMDNRFLLGGGLRFMLSNSEKKGIFIGADIMYEHERWDNPENDNTYIIKDLPKFSFYYSMHINTGNISKFRTVFYYQTGYDPNPGLVRNRISYDVQFEVLISKKLFFNVKFTGSFEDKPIYPINRSIYTIENGLG